MEMFLPVLISFVLPCDSQEFLMEQKFQVSTREDELRQSNIETIYKVLLRTAVHTVGTLDTIHNKTMSQVYLNNAPSSSTLKLNMVNNPLSSFLPYNPKPFSQKLYEKGMRVAEDLLRSCAMAVHLFMMLPARAIATVIILYLFFHGSAITQLIVALYFVHLVCDWKTPHQGGRRLDWFRGSSYFKYMAHYFPMKLVQTADLSPDRNYLVVCHPHGVWFLAYTLAFAADAFRLEKLKGLRTFLTTINSNFILPFAREYLLAAGFVSVSERSIKYLLEEPKGGNLVSVLPGGSAEAALAEPGQYHILLKTRKGFCRLALQTGSDLVPSFTFGEMECYCITKTAENGILAQCQRFIKKLTCINPVLYRNPNSSLYFFSMPKRSPITVVIGSPIKVEKNENASQRDIDELHSKYVEKVRNLFENEKHKYLNNADSINLIIN